MISWGVKKKTEPEKELNPVTLTQLIEKKEPLMTIPLLHLCYLEQLTDIVVIVVKGILLMCTVVIYSEVRKKILKKVVDVLFA